MFRIALCDDQEYFVTKLKSDITSVLKKYGWCIEIQEYVQGERLIKDLKERCYDIIFLDIDMPNINGFAIAELIHRRYEDILLIFCTSHKELVYDSFVYQPFWFICKENYEKELDKIVLNAKKRVEHLHKYYKFQIQNKIYNVLILDIKYFHVSKHKIYIQINKMEELSFRDNLSNIENIFVNLGFVKVNSGCIVNLEWIMHINMNEVMLKDNETILISRSNIRNVKSKFLEYTRLK